MDIKGLKEKLGLTKEQEQKFDRMKVQFAVLVMKLLSSGGNLHGVNAEATRKRRAKNKVARKQRRVNRGRAR